MPRDEEVETLVEGQGRRSEPRGEPQHLDKGATVGRYIVTGMLGEGGMGVVYAAYDPELDRKVAIKLLQARPSEGSRGGQAWLLREAQAMAKLAHPNVIAVHDVGTLPGDRVFIAMELVEGITLRTWLEQRRTWREIVGILRAAGAGLAAAHAAGIVHRDFKPDNVLVGADGRVRVMDFGVAIKHEEKGQPLEVAGTPAYMAPEIYDGKAADPRTDQFAFGVALYEALFAVPPFENFVFGVPRAGEPLPAPRPPPESTVPAAIQRVVMRAIAIAPEQRYPDMAALLADLAIDPGARRRRVLVALGAVAALAGVGAGAYLLSHRGGDALCRGAERRLAGVWDGTRREAVHQAFAATRRPFADRSFAAVAAALDGYTREWTDTSVESCRATRVRRDQTEEVLSLRQTCLDERLEELRAFTGLLGDADEALVEKGDKAVWELEPIARCSNVAALRAPGAPPPEAAAKLAEIRNEIAQAKAQLIAGKAFPSLVASQKAIDGARALHFEPMVAEALLVRGSTQAAAQNFEDGAVTLADATWSGVRSGRDDVVALAAIARALITSDTLGRPSEAKIWIGLARAAAARVGIDRALEHSLLMAEGMVAAQSEDPNAAIAAHEKSLAAAELQFGHDSPALWSDEELLGATLTKANAYGKALPHFERALALRERSVGPDHPDVAMVLSNMGVAYRHVGQGDKARAAYERALAIRERMYGPNNPLLLPTLNNMADYLRQADPEGALVMIERADKMAERFPGPEHPMSHTVRTTHAETLAAAHRHAEARAMFDELLERETKLRSPVLGTTLTSRAELALDEHQWSEAAGFAQRAVDQLEQAGGKDNPELWHPLTVLGRAELALQHRDAARAALERALALATQGKITETDLAITRKTLDQAR